MSEKVICGNGVRIVHEKMEHMRSAAIGIWVKAGSMDEDASEAGLAHFIEHMMFKGTAERSAKDIAEQFDQLGGDVNAFTSKELTCYFATVLGHQAEKALEVLADMFFHSVFDPSEIEKEKSVILEEIASVEDTPEEDVDELLWSSMYPGHPLGRPVGGIEETIGLFDQAKIKAFMAKHYIPCNIVISIAGNYPEDLIERVEELFGSFTGREDEQPAQLPAPLFQKGITEKGKEIEQVHLCIGYQGIPLEDPRLHDLILLDSILGGTMSSRLFQEVREERGLAYTVYSYYSAYQDAGAFVIYAGMSPAKVNETIQTIDGIIQELLDKGITERELSNAKEQLKGSFLLGLESTEAIMHRNGRNELILREHKSVEEVVELIDAVTVNKVEEIARTLLTEERTISIVGPGRLLEGAGAGI